MLAITENGPFSVERWRHFVQGEPIGVSVAHFALLYSQKGREIVFIGHQVCESLSFSIGEKADKHFYSTSAYCRDISWNIFTVVS